MKISKALLALLSAVAAVGSNGCSTTPSARDRFETLDYDSKSVFLTYYPYLTPSQREDFLSNPDVKPRDEIESWSGQLNDPDHEVTSFDEMMSHPLNRRIAALHIEMEIPEPITQGTQVPLHAFAIYPLKKKPVEATADADWEVDSRLAQIKRDGATVSLQFECVDSNVTVSANFLGERETSRSLQIRKPLESLQLKVSEAYIGADAGYYFKLILTARCQDGTESDVSCQASWSSLSNAGKIEGCGNFVISSKEELAKEEALTVTANYGNLSLRKTLRPPIH